MANNILEAFSDFGRELLENIRNNAHERISDAEFEERIIGIEKATAAMMEAGVEEEIIIKMLQKYWDLRLSEANVFIEKQHNQDK